MKTFAAKVKRSAPAVSGAHSYIHHPTCAVQQNQQAVMRNILRPEEVQANQDIGEHETHSQHEVNNALTDTPFTTHVGASTDGDINGATLQRSETDESEQELQALPEENELEETIQAKSIQPSFVDMRNTQPSGFGYARPETKIQQANIHRILHSTGVQAKLTMGQPNDKYEQEADRVADQVMAMPDQTLQRQPENEEQEGIAQAKLVTEAITPLAQCNSESASTRADTVPQSVSDVLAHSGRPLEKSIQTNMESRFGRSFDHVRIQTDDMAAHSSRDIDAKAYTVGHRIVFGAGQYQPESYQGKHLLAHELTHVVQQASPVRSEAKVSRQHEQLVLRKSIPVRHRSPPQISRANPTPVARKTRLQLIGDGTAANPGVKMRELRPYLASQADWFSEPTLTAADRDLVWSTVTKLDQETDFRAATAELRVADVGGLSSADQILLDTFADGFDSTVDTIRLHNPVTTVTDGVDKGSAMSTLLGFVHPLVMRVVIPESGLNYLVTNSKTPELQKYYTDFEPTLENPDEWQYIEPLLTTGITTYMALKGWVSDLHSFRAPALVQLITNVADTSRSKPVLLILHAATDWNSAFIQAANIEHMVLNTGVSDPNLALLLQGFGSLGALATKSSNIARDYGEQDVLGINVTGFPPSVTVRRGPGRLGQVVIAGHGETTNVDMAVDRTIAPTNRGDKYLSYSGEDLDNVNNRVNTRLLIDTLINNMDPSAARIVFAGCLVGSRSFPAGMGLSSPAAAITALRSNISSNENLRDFVNARLSALGASGQVIASMGSTGFSSFDVDASGQVGIPSTGFDPAIAGSAAGYVQNGKEPEGAMRAALETYADSAIGPTQTTTWMRARVAALAGNGGWYVTQTRSAYQIALPPVGNVDPAMLLDLSHRVVNWLLAGWNDSINVASLSTSVHSGEEAIVFGGMLASTIGGTRDHIKVGVREAWLSLDPLNATRITDFETALSGSTLTRTTFKPLLVRSIVNPHLSTLLPVVGPYTRGRMLLALTIAFDDGTGMPATVRDFLRAAAGGSATTAFPAALNVTTLLGGSGESRVLQDIGLAMGTPPAAPSSGGAAPVPDANVDLDRDSSNERFIAIARREASVTAYVLRVRSRPSMSASTTHFLRRHSIVRVMGTIGAWSMIDHNGQVGFVGSRHIV